MNAFAKSLMDRSVDFAIRVVKLSAWLSQEKREYVMSRQILKSGTSIGANIREAQFAQSDLDFISKLSIAVKEGAETQYWLEILIKTEYITAKQYSSLNADCNRLVGLLARSIKRMKSKVTKSNL